MQRSRRTAGIGGLFLSTILSAQDSANVAGQLDRRRSDLFRCQSQLDNADLKRERDRLSTEIQQQQQQQQQIQVVINNLNGDRYTMSREAGAADHREREGVPAFRDRKQGRTTRVFTDLVIGMIKLDYDSQIKPVD